MLKTLTPVFQLKMSDPPQNLDPEPKLPIAKAAHTADDFIQGILQGDRIMLGQAITLIESQLPAHRQMAHQIIEGCLPEAGKSIRIGITGSPGVGKSTFIEKLGQQLINQRHRIAVLAIDPSSQLSKGSILGDKTRMQQLSNSDRAFIRPSPAGSSLGGVARHTRESIILCEAAGHDVIFVETVGVGQSETMVHSMVDFFLLLLLPGAGDELQGIKRGIVEMADLLVVNKAEGDRLAMAKSAKQEYRNALHLLPPKAGGWTPKVLLCSALDGHGILEVWQCVEEYVRFTKGNGQFNEQRRQQAKFWMEESLRMGWEEILFKNESVKAALPNLEAAVLAGELSPFKAAEQVIHLFLHSFPQK